MTKTLTEQWREGELPIDLYYVIDKLGRETIGNDCGIRDMMVDAFNGGNIFIKEVLAPVPSYDKVKEMSQKIERLEFDNEVLDNELKELSTKNDTLAMENGRLKERLAIAIKALKEYDNKLNWDIRGISFMKYNKGFTIARKALKEMEGVK